MPAVQRLYPPYCRLEIVRCHGALPAYRIRVDGGIINPKIAGLKVSEHVTGNVVAGGMEDERAYALRGRVSLWIGGVEFQEVSASGRIANYSLGVYPSVSTPSTVHGTSAGGMAPRLRSSSSKFIG